MRHCKQLKPLPDRILLLQLFGEDVGVVEEVDLEGVLIEEGDEIGSGELDILNLIRESQRGDEERLILFLLDGGVAIE